METDLHFKKYKDNLTSLEQGNLGQLWRQEMDTQNSWIKLPAFCHSQNIEGIHAYVGGNVFEEDEPKASGHQWAGLKGRKFVTKTRFPLFQPITIEGSVTGKAAVARPMLEESQESQKYRDQGNWTNLVIKRLSEKILDASYSKEEIVQEV